MPVLGSTTSVPQPDEDFINKSLLASLDAQADAEPLDDSDHTDLADKSAPHFHPRIQQRPDSPFDRPQESYHTMHAAHSNMFEYPNDIDAPRYNPKPNANYRASFTSFPNTTRNRLGHQASQPALNSAALPFRDTPSFYPGSDAFSAGQMTSPVPTHMQPYDHRPSYEFSHPNGSHKPFLPDQFPPPSMHNPGKPAPQQQQPHGGFPSSHIYSNGVQLSSQTPYGPHVPTMPNAANPAVPPGLSNSSSMNMPNGSNTAANGEEISTIFVVGFPDDMQEREFQNMFTFSQGFEAATLKIPNKEYTAYGSLAGPNMNPMRGSNSFQFAGQNDPYNLVTLNQGGVVVDNGRDGPISSWPASQHPQLDDMNPGHFIGVGPGGAGGLGMGMGVNNNPNLPPRKQIIGFAKFRTREEALAARDALQGRRVDIEKGAVLKAEMAKKNLHTKRGVGPLPGVGGVGAANQAQQQQQHANGLGADPYGMDPSYPPVGPSNNNRDSMQSLGRLGGWRDSIAGLQQQHPNSQIPMPPDANGPVNGTREEEDRKRESVLSLGLGVAGLSLGPGGVSPSMAPATSVAIPGTAQRAPRERVEEDERERRRKEIKDNVDREQHLMRLRARDVATFDAFHSVPAAQTSTSPNANGIGSAPISRQSSNASATSLSGVSPWASTSTAPTTESALATSPTLDEPETAHQKPIDIGEACEQREDIELQSQVGENGIVGPWDRINNVNLRSAAHASGSERSSSPLGIDAQHPPLQTQRQSATYQPQFLHLHEQQQQAAQAQQQLYHSSSQSEPSETGSAVGAPDAPYAQSAQNPIGYVGAPRAGPGGFGAPGQGQGQVQSAASGLVGQSTFPRGGAAPFVPLNANGVLGQQAPIGAASQRAPNAITTAASTTGAPSSGSSAAGSVSGGNTSPQLPSPASANGTGSTTSITSATGGGVNGIGGGSGVVRGTVDQNPPINTLYVGNLPTSPPPIGYPSDLEETLREVFSTRPGYRKLCYRHKANGPMCFVEFENVEYAARALQEMSGHTLRGAVKNGIRLSYSKNPLGVRTPTSAGANQGGPTLQQQQQLTQSLNNHHFQQAQQYHHQQQQHHQQQGGLPPPLHSPSSVDDFHAPMGHRGILPSSILRRDSVLSPTSPTSLAQAQAQPGQSFLGSNGSGAANGGVNGGSNNINNNGNGNNSFLSSPPPRFYSTSPGSGMAFGTASTGTPLTGASSAFVPRSAMNVNGAGNGGAGGFNGGSFFSPFAVPPHFSTPNEGPFGQLPGSVPPPPPHMQSQLQSIPNESQQQLQHQQQGGPNEE